MRSAPLPPDEPQRLLALYRYEVLDTPAEDCFDRFTRLAATLVGVPVSVISFVDADRQWFKAGLGSDVRETPRDIAFCAHAILGDEPMVVEDARLDERFHDNPLVTGPDGVCFYAGAPIRTNDGFNVGVLCAIDRVPRHISAEQLRALSELAALVASELELRDTNRRLASELEERKTMEAERLLSQQRLRDYLDTASDWLWETDDAHRFTLISDEAATMLPARQAIGLTRIEASQGDPRHPKWRSHLADLEARRPFKNFRYAVKRPGDETAYLETSGKPVFDVDGRFQGYRGTGRDVTALVEAEKAIRDMTARLDAALQNMSQGLCMFGPDGVLMVCNERFRLMYELPREACAPGAARAAIVGFQTKPGGLVTPSQAPGYIAGGCGAAERRILLELTDGRTIAVVRERMPDGGWLETHEDVTERQRSEQKITFLAHNDPLTGLANRARFLQDIDEACSSTLTHESPIAVLMLDLDRFKEVNDSLGHDAGDTLLQHAAQRLNGCTRETDRLARIGGDEFAIIQSPPRNPAGAYSAAEAREDAATLAARIVDVISHPYEINGQKLVIGASIGIAVAPGDGDEPTELMKKADLALYRVKAQGRNGYCMFKPEMMAEAEERHTLERELRDALARQQLELLYQPIVDMRTLKPCAFEALVRWRHPEHGLIPPARFIDVAEQTGLIELLGEWILQTACAEAARWPEDVRLAVNISPAQFRKSNLLDVILCALVESGLPPERLEIEITESVLLAHEPRNLSTLHQIKNLGIAIALDDFGTGYASLSYLTAFPFDKLKIDKSFTRGLTRSDCAAIVWSASSLGQSLGMTVVAEGVETQGQLDALRIAGIAQAQGLLLGYAVPAPEIQFGPATSPNAVEAA